MKSTVASILILFAVSCNEIKKESNTDPANTDLKEMSISCDLIDNWERAKVFTRQYLEAMPEEHYDFRPTPEILPFAHEFLHVACVNFRYAAMIAGGNDCNDYDDVYNNPSLQSKPEVIAFVMASYDAMIETLTLESDLDQPTYYYRWTCSKACLSMKGFEHQTHHRGKAAIYLRLKGVTPPTHMLVEDWSIPKDISKEDWEETPAYKNYSRAVN